MENKNNSLFDAAWAGDDKAIIALLSEGMDINTQYDLGATPVYAAAQNNKASTVQLLINNGADIEIPIITNATPLYAAAINCYPEVLNLLINAGANLEVRVDGYTPIFVAIYAKCVQNIAPLLNAGAKIYFDVLSYHEISTPLSLNSFNYNAEDKTEGVDEIYPIVLNHYWKITAPEIQAIDQSTINNGKTFEVVVVRYKEDLSWVAKEFPSDKVTIYNKGPDDIGKLPSNCHVINIENIGYLGGTYLKHIVDNYNNLADRTLFIQGHPYDVNAYFPLIRHKGDLDSNCKNIIAKCVNTTLAKEWDFLDNLKWDFMPRYKDFVPRNASMLDFHYKYIGNQSLDEDMYVTYGAIFAADKEVILRHGVEHYAAMLPEFNYTKPMVDHYMEREWDQLFDLVSIDKVVKMQNLQKINEDNRSVNDRLYNAVIHNDIEAVKLLLDAGSNPNIGDNFGNYPLHLSIKKGNYTISKLLLDYGASPNLPLPNGKYILQEVVVSGNADMVKLLLQYGADKEVTYQGLYPAIMAYSSRNPEIFQLLVEKTETVFSREGVNEVALIEMVKNEEDIIFENLVWHFVLGFRKFIVIDNLSSDNTKQEIERFAELSKNYAKVFIIDDPVFEHIQSRITTGAYDFARSVWPEVKWVFPVDADEFWITKKPLRDIINNIPVDAEVLQSTVIKYRPHIDYYEFEEAIKFYDKLHYLSYEVFSPPGVKIILKAQDCIKIGQGNHDAIRTNCGDGSQLKIYHGYQLGIDLHEFKLRSVEQTHNKFSRSMASNLKARELGLIKDTDGIHTYQYINYIDRYGDKAGEYKFNESFVDLDYAIDDPLPIGAAIDLFYEITSINNFLMTSVVKNNLEDIKEAIFQGADVNYIHSIGATALYMTVDKGFVAATEVLLKSGANPDIKTTIGTSPLCMAAQDVNFPMVELLINNGADMEVSYDNGATSLYLAAHMGSIEIVEFLLEHGANKNVIVNGINSFERSIVDKHYDIAKLLADDIKVFCQEIPELVMHNDYAELCGKVEISNDGQDL